jgi:hypothetical protein
MNTILPFRFVLICHLALSVCHAEEAFVIPSAQGGAMAQATYQSASDDQLAILRNRPLFAGQASAGKTDRPPLTINETSDFIAFDGFCTLVPKGAILFVPDRMRAGVVAAPSGELVLWLPFLSRNTARIIPLEVTIRQASGMEPINPRVLESAAKSGHMVVAVMQGSPTSVAVNPHPKGQAQANTNL